MRWMFLLFFVGSLFTVGKVQAQDQEIQQLLLDVEKLSQFKRILSDMKTGYHVVMKGYTAVRDISKGNFNLHKAFLDGLLAVSPTVRKYKKISATIQLQLRIVHEFQSYSHRFSAAGTFSPDEILYMGRIYNNLLDQSLENISDLTTVVTAGRVRMTDAERLAQIDRIYQDTLDKLLFLRSFNNQNAILMLQRIKGREEIGDMQKIIEH